MNDDRIDALSRKIDVLVEGLLDHIRMVAESAASRDETLARELEAFRNENRSEHKTMIDVLSDHETRIVALERRIR